MLTIDNPSKFDWANMPLSDCCEGNAMDAHFTLKLYDLICEKLSDQPVWKLIEEVVMPSIEHFAAMEHEGIDIDLTALETVGKQLRSKNMNEEDDLYDFKCITKDDNLSSTADLIDILYTRDGGFELYPPDRTAKGKPSVSAPTLKLLLEQIDEELKDRE